MLSSVLMARVSSLLPDSAKETQEPAPDELAMAANPNGSASVRVSLNKDGLLEDVNQIDHYLHRDSTLSQMNFYDFVRFTCIQRDTRPNTSQTEHRSSYCDRCALTPPHPWASSHVIVLHTNFEKGHGSAPLVPRMIGCTPPRTNDPRFKLFVLAHFKPFSFSSPLVLPSETILSTYDTHSFNAEAQSVMENWEEMHECSDQRDAERLKKREAAAREDKDLTRAMLGDEDDDEGLNHVRTDTMDIDENFDNNPFTSALRNLEQCGWLTASTSERKVTSSASTDMHAQGITPSKTDIKRWKTLIKDQEDVVAQARRTAMDPTLSLLNSPLSQDISAPETEAQCAPPALDVNTSVCPPTENSIPNDSNKQKFVSSAEMIRSIAAHRKLNNEQLTAFNLIAEEVVSCVLQSPSEEHASRDPLRLFMTGKGGTGKSYVVNSVKEILARYGCQHMMRMLAPTGAAANVIGGTTIHRGLRIKVQQRKNGKGKGNRELGEDKDDYSIVINRKDILHLQEEWKVVRIVFIDEVSLLSAQLLAEVDQSLRVAKQVFDQWFGGLIVIFAGDFHQYAPVGGTALYTPITDTLKDNTDAVNQRLGRLCWKSLNAVIELNKQERMKDDEAYGTSVSRLRLRTCTEDDMRLFNSRVIRTPLCPNGIDMEEIKAQDATVLVAQNLVRIAINSVKARVNCHGEH
jgi:hypothetical protein